ncbi:copper transporter [Phycicoccus duodecadis]|uniref:Copper transport outer membrane protein MctB n=1 Tax=Phycicoccus duodecadis TaxID=173053 RepID=A0A2N3YN78_9MICO|nr:copper transporter [Phycicoccus duodecadis]PKW28312.1 copper transport outer membrane protein MctB [Phycicoccus duodecadis]
MIDFRYHIVSIVSIFLALAVGIVLGAGPLQGEIGSTLQNEIAGLRDDKAQLNTERDALQAKVEQRDAYLAAVSSRVLAGTLTERTVALVVLPGADAAASEAVTEAVDAAGGRIASTTSVSADWVSTNQKVAGTRDRLVQQAAKDAAVDPGSAAALTPRDVLLATLLTRTAPAGDSGPDDETARAALQTLADGGLLSIDAPAFTRAELVVVLSGAVTDGSEQVRTGTAQRWVGLAAALDARSRGVVVAADIESEPTGTSVLTTLREDSAVSKAVSGVDDVASPTGVASVVFGLAEQNGGSAGQYGLGPRADAAYAPVPGT